MATKKTPKKVTKKATKKDTGNKELNKLMQDIDFEAMPVRKANIKAHKINKGSNMKKTIITIIATVVITLALVFAGVKTYEHIYNKGVNDEKAHQAMIKNEVDKQLKD